MVCRAENRSKTGVGRGADAELGFGKQFQHRGGAEMRGRVPVNIERIGILRGQDLHAGVALERTLQIVKLVVDLRDNSRIRESRADFLCDIQRRSSQRNVLDTAVRQGNVNVGHGDLACRKQGAETAGPLRGAQLAQGLGLDLADAFPRDVELLADFLERVLALASDPESQPDDLLLFG